MSKYRKRLPLVLAWLAGAEEIRTATRAIKADPRLSDASFTLMTVAEPAKEDVLAWTPGRRSARKARVMAATGSGAVEVEVDLAERRVVSLTRRDGVEGALTLTEYMEGAKVALAHSEFQEGLRKRGVTDLAKVMCGPFSAGWFDLPEYQGRRLIKVLCFDLRRSTNNVFGWPIERLSALVDLRTREVLRVVDDGVVLVNDGDHNFSGAAAVRSRPGTTTMSWSTATMAGYCWTRGCAGQARPVPRARRLGDAVRAGGALRRRRLHVR